MPREVHSQGHGVDGNWQLGAGYQSVSVCGGNEGEYQGSEGEHQAGVRAGYRYGYG